MSPFKALGATLASLLVGVTGAGAQTPSRGAPHLTDRPSRPAAVVLDRVTVVDVESGMRRREQRVIVVGNRITAIGRPADLAVPRGARLVEARGKYLIPGLWDMHIHPGWDVPREALNYPRAQAIYQELVANGVTGIRDAGNATPPDSFRVWRRAAAAGRRVLPRMIVSGSPLEFGRPPACPRDSLGGPGACRPGYMVLIDRPDEAGRLVDSIQATGVDMIKIHMVPRPIWFAIAAAARRVGIPFGGHFQRNMDSLPPAIDGLVASDSGVRILDHEPWADVCGWHADSVESLPRCAAAAAHLRRNHTWIAFLDDPTGDDVLEALAAPDSFRAHALRYTPPKRTQFDANTSAWQPPSAAERRQLPTGAGFAAAVPDSIRQSKGCRRALLAYAADVPWMPGPDLPVNYHVPAVHLALLRPVLCGVPPLWALRAATLNPARALGLEDSLGTVAVGKVADLVLLEGDPLEDIWNVTKIAAVVANGRYFDRAALDRLLAEADAAWRRVATAQGQAKGRP